MTEQQYEVALSKDEQIIYDQMLDYSNTYSDMPDGAFFALAEDMYGWDFEDWGWFNDQQSDEQN